MPVKHQGWGPFANIVNSMKLLNILSKASIVYICQSSEYISEYVQDIFEKKLTNQFSILLFFFLICINFLGKNVFQMKAENSDINRF